MTFKYAVNSNGRLIGTGIGPGRRVNPNDWSTGTDPVRHEKYYAYLKHRCQAKFRKEQHSLTWEQWEQLWPDHLWAQRGRSIDSLCLQQIEPGAGWHEHTVEIVTKKQHFKDIKKRNANA